MEREEGIRFDANGFESHESINLVYGHNDPLAHEAYLAAKDAGQDQGMFYLGVDGLPDQSVAWVCKGELTATFLYATPGAEGIRQALKIVNGEKVPKKITLETLAIDKTNCEAILNEHEIS
jgi:ribose transport system substrate-binding protein